MKIFNWVHRKLKDGSAAQNAKNNGTAIFDETGDANQFLVDNNAFGDSVFGCWKGGILTIGTFGYDPLTKDAAEVDEQDYDHDIEFHVNDRGHESEEVESAENDETITDSEEDEVVDEDKEANPLVYAVYAHDYEALLQQYDPAADYVKTNGNKDFDHVMMLMQENDRDVDADMKKDRITLADLFSADHWDADELQKKQSKKKLHELMEEKASSKKHSHGRLAFAKKLLLAGGAGDSKDARPIHKLHRLVRRMLKRKIHPVSKEVNESNMEYIPKVNESVPLLPITQDGNGA